jgi:hypothetical protein
LDSNDLTGVSKPKKTWRRTIFAAMSHAGLLLSHLPSALLAAPVIVLFSFLSSERPERWRAFGHSIAVGVLGIALGAFYVLPAMMLRDTMACDPWITGQGWYNIATNWPIGTPDLPGFGRQVYEALGGTSAFGIGSWAVHTVLRKSRFGVALARPAGHLTAPIITVLCSCRFLISMLLRPLWEYLPFLSQVQFPWRTGVLVDLCSLLLVALFAPPVIESAFAALGFEGRRRRALEGAFCTLALAVLAGLVIDVHFPTTVQAKTDFERIPAPIEYRPPWLVESPTYLGTRTAQELRDIDTEPKAHREGVARWERRVNRLLPPLAPHRPSRRGVGVSSRRTNRPPQLRAPDGSTRAHLGAASLARGDSRNFRLAIRFARRRHS